MTIKTTLSTNSLASNVRAVADLCGLRASDVRHNGGKVVILTVDGGNVAEVTERLDAAHQVTGYEVRS